MRSIKFRGKRVDNGEWIFGYFFITETGHWVGEYNDEQLVIPETVGQFTGMIDKSGKEIYEKDILASVPNSQSRYVVYFKKSDLKFTSRFEVLDIDEDEKEYWRTQYDDHSIAGALTYNNYVIGNIHDLNQTATPL